MVEIPQVKACSFGSRSKSPSRPSPHCARRALSSRPGLGILRPLNHSPACKLRLFSASEGPAEDCASGARVSKMLFRAVLFEIVLCSLILLDCAVLGAVVDRLLRGSEPIVAWYLLDCLLTGIFFLEIVARWWVFGKSVWRLVPSRASKHKRLSGLASPVL